MTNIKKGALYGRLFTGCTAALLATAPDFAIAQTASTETAQSGGIKDIIVTARRRAERLQDVPTAVTALTADTLSTLNVARSEDLNTIAAGLSVTHVGDRQRVFFDLRGQGQQNNGGEPGVAVYFDEVPLLRGGLDFFDIGQIEVLRGPQGTLFGRNTTGGAVRIRPALPTFEFEGYVEGRVGNLDAHDLEAAINLPVIDDVLAVRVAGTRIRRDGYVRNIFRNQRLNDEHTDSIRAQVLFTPGERFEDRMLFSYRNVNTNGTALIPNTINPIGPAAVTAFNLGQSSDFRQFRSEALGTADAKEYVFENIASLELSDDVTVRHIFGLIRSTTRATSDVDGTELPVLLSNKRDPGQVMTNELQFLGKAFDNKLDWIVGGYYERSKTRGEGNTLRFDAFGRTTTTAANLTGRSRALFAQVNYELSPQFSVTAGLRWTWDVRNGLTGRSTTTALPPLTIATKFKADAPNWTVSLNYKPSDDVLLYLATRRGYKSGGINAFVSPPVPTGFGLETLSDIEVGVKSTFQTGNVAHRLNASGFYGWYDQIQRVGVFTDVNGSPTTIIYNAGDARTMGGEVEYNAKFGDLLDFSAQYAYLKVDFQKYTFFDGRPLLDQTAANAPKHKFTVFGNLYAPINPDLGELFLNVKYAYQSRVQFTEPNIVNYEQAGYGLLDASLNWNNLAGKPIDASLFVKNATDKRFFQGGGFPNFLMMDIGPVRTYGLKIRYRFGASAD